MHFKFDKLKNYKKPLKKNKIGRYVQVVANKLCYNGLVIPLKPTEISLQDCLSSIEKAGNSLIKK